MGRLGNISGKEAVKAFQKAGWQPNERDKGYFMKASGRRMENY